MSAPWLKFYPRDWRGDQALRAVSLAARGLWMECICIMHEARPYGHLLLNGSPVEDDTLARMAGVSVDEVSALLTELRQAGVLSVTAKGVVFSRRMTRDHARAQKGRKAITRRWSQPAENTQQKDGPNRLPNRLPITQKPEARSQIQEEKPSAFIGADKTSPPKAKRRPSCEARIMDILTNAISERNARAVIEHRKAIKKPLTERGAELLAQKFMLAMDPEDAAETMIGAGWAGFELEWYRRLKPSAKIVERH